MSKITIEEKIKIEMKVQSYIKYCEDNNRTQPTQETLQRLRNANTQQIIHNKFCDENYTFNCIQKNPKNEEGIDDKSFALVDISFSKDILKDLEKQIVQPLNKFYKDKGGKEDSYLDVGAIISHVLEKGLDEFFYDECSDFYYETEKEILEEVRRKEIV